jgi:hypothetical protein
VAAGAGIGVLVGLLVVGPLARAAMFVLRLTSTDAVRGVTSDDGFTIGRFDLLDTLGLIGQAGLTCGVLAFVYSVCRGAIARPATRIGLWTLVCATVGGALLVHSDGIDFRLLEPLWLAVGLFVALPAVAGVAVALAVDRVHAMTEPSRTLRLGLPALSLLSPPAAAAAALYALGSALVGSRRPPAALVRAARAALVAVALGVSVAGVADLARDVARLA